MDARKIDIRPTIDQSKKYKDLGADVFYDGKECKVIQHKGGLAKRANALRSIINDLKECEAYVDLLHKDNSNVISGGLHKALVITYGKCFSQGDSRGLSLDKTKVLKGGDHEILKSHSGIIEMRNKFVAHSDHDEFDCGEVSVVLPPDGMESLKGCVLTVNQKYGSYPKEALVKVSGLLAYVLCYTTNELNNCSSAILKMA